MSNSPHKDHDKHLKKLLIMPLGMIWIFCITVFFFILFEEKSKIKEGIYFTIQDNLNHQISLIQDDVYMGLVGAFDQRIENVIKRVKIKYPQSTICIIINQINIDTIIPSNKMNCSDNESPLEMGESHDIELIVDNNVLSVLRVYLIVDLRIIDVFSPVFLAGIIVIFLIFSLIYIWIYWQVKKNLMNPLIGILNQRNKDLLNKNNDLQQAYEDIKFHEQQIDTQNKELQRLDKLKDEFLANTSHELKNPLNSIIGLTEVLLNNLRTSLPPSYQNDLQIIINSGRRLFNLVDGILDFSKLKHHDLQINPQPLRIRLLTEAVLSLFSPRLEKTSFPVVNTIPDDLPLVLADEDRIQQIFFNLIDNALKFTHEGEIRLSAEEKGNFLKIQVSDTGIGIPQEKQAIIFESFEQADGSITREYGGTGLGLSISKHLVKLHGGDMTVESTAKGSTFAFTLPLVEETNQAIEISTRLPSIQLQALKTDNSLDVIEPQASDRVSSTAFHILVVDDDSANLLVLQRQLEALGYQITTCLNGKEALAHIESDEKFHLALLDIMMPRMSGYEVCEKIREKYAEDVLPIIFITAKNQVSDLVEGLGKGGNDYLSKPFLQAELIARVQAHIRVQEGVERWVSLREINRQYGDLKPEEYSNFVVNECARLHIASMIRLWEIKKRAQEIQEPYSYNLVLPTDQNLTLARKMEDGDFRKQDILYLERVEQDLKLLSQNEHLTTIKGMYLSGMITPKILYVESRRYKCVFFYEDKTEKTVEISLKLIEKCHDNLLRIKQQQVINRDQIIGFSYQALKGRRKRQNFSVSLKTEDNNLLSLKIGETYIDSLFSQLPPPQKEQFQKVILDIFPDYFLPQSN